MQKTLALVLAIDRAEEMGVLTQYRPKSVLAFGGIYRFIDFVMSNLMHSDITRVGLLFQYRPNSLLKHVGSGAAWDMIGGNREVTMLPPMRKPQKSEWYQGTADAVYQNIEFIKDEDPDLVLIVSSDYMYYMDYQDLIDFHMQNDAEVSVAFVEVSNSDTYQFGQAEIDNCCGERGGRIKRYMGKLSTQISNWGSPTIYLFETETLITTLVDYVEDKQEYGFDEGILPNLISHNRVFGYKHDGYLAYANTIDEYWSINMEFLKKPTRFSPKERYLRTNLKNGRICDRPPTVFSSKAVTTESLIHSGCDISGHIEHSIIFPGVSVAEGAIVRDSILMFDSTIEENVIIEKTILDVEVNVGRDSQIGIGGLDAPNEQLPNSLRSGVTVIGRNTYVPKRMKIGKNCMIYPNLDEGDFTVKTIKCGSTLV